MGYKNFKDRKEYQAFYRENNKEKLKQWHKKWYEEHKEQVKAKLKEFNLKYPGRISENRRKWADRNVEKRMYKNAKGRATRENILFNLEVSDIVVPSKCPILNIDFKHDNRGSAKYNSPSLDRIDNSKGYIKGNVQVISYRANTMKGDATPKDLIQFAFWVILTYGHLIDKKSS
jgi:hypothetical protein